MNHFFLHEKAFPIRLLLLACTLLACRTNSPTAAQTSQQSDSAYRAELRRRAQENEPPAQPNNPLPAQPSSRQIEVTKEGAQRVPLLDCHLSWIPPAGWSAATDPHNPWIRVQQVSADGQIVASLAVGAWPRNGRTPEKVAEESNQGTLQVLGSGVESIPDHPAVPWLHMRIPSGLEQVWWFVEHGEISVKVVCTAHPTVLPSVRDRALPAIASMRFEEAPEGFLLDPGFQVAKVTIDETRRLSPPGTPVSLVLPTDWKSLNPASEIDLLVRERLLGPSQAYCCVRLQRMPFPGAVQGDMHEHLAVLEKNARQSLGLRETIQQGSFEVSGRQAIYLEGRGSWSVAPEPFDFRFLLVLVSDNGMCYQLSLQTTEDAVVPLQSMTLEAVRSLRFDA